MIVKVGHEIMFRCFLLASTCTFQPDSDIISYISRYVLQIMLDNVVVLFSYRRRVQEGGGEGGRKRGERGMEKEREKEEKGEEESWREGEERKGGGRREKDTPMYLPSIACHTVS